MTTDGEANLMSSSRRQLLTNHNRCWIWGRNVVLETLRAGYWPVIQLLSSDRCESESRTEAIAIAGRHGVEATSVSDAELTKHCRSEEHQGLAARMRPYPYREVDELISGLPANPVVVMLDRIQDSYNFGAIIRSVDVLGIHAVIVGRQEQAPVNSLVARSSAGAVNYVPIAQAESLSVVIHQLRGCGFQIIGTSDRAPESIFETNLRRATLLLIGNEGRGIQPELQSLCTQFVQIPVVGKVNSLNAAVSAGILFYETLRQRSLTRDNDG
jgi:23S rRNA (guanosine2251-2'-O)-methyltransferase